MEKHLREVLHGRRKPMAKRSWRCLDDADIAAYVDQQVGADARIRIEQHLADCDFCLEQVAFLARQPEQASAVPLPEAVRTRARALAERRERRAWLPYWRWVAVPAATAVIALAVGLSLREQGLVVSTPAPPEAPTVEKRQGEAEVARQRAARQTVRGVRSPSNRPELISPADRSILSRGKVKFRWTEFRGALFYEVRLVTAEGDLVWETRVQADRIVLPAAIRLQPEQSYFVWVVAHLPEGRSVKSEMVSFRVKKND